MNWLNHPKFARRLDQIGERLRANSFHFKRISSVIFLCGGADSPRRLRIADYLRREHPECLLFFADEVWPVIAQLPGQNALAMEAQLADLSDLVIIVVESPGTFAELGAFSLSDKLRKKLLPIIDIAHKAAPSFINTGPVRWIEAESAFAPAIWADLDTVLKAAGQIEDRLGRLPPEGKARITDLSASPKHFLFFVCDLIAVLGPCDLDTVDALIKRILGERKPSAASYVGLAKSMSIIDDIEVDGRIYYFRPLDAEQKLPAFHRNKFIDLAWMRAEMVGAMESIPDARRVLAKMKEPHP